MVKNCMKRNVISVSSTASIREAALLVVEKHIGLLPVVDPRGRPIGVLGLQDLLTLELPAFIKFIKDIDFVHNFGAVETTRPSPEKLNRPVTELMKPLISVDEDCGLLRAYALMIQHNLHDLPVIAPDGTLVGIASRVDIGTAILSAWSIVPGRSP